MSRYSNSFACLTSMLIWSLLLLLPAYLRSIETFLRGARRALLLQLALPVPHSGPHQWHHDDVAQQCATRTIKTLLGNTPRFLSPHQTPNGAQLPLQPFLESHTAILVLWSHSSLYCNLFLSICTVMTFELLIYTAVTMSFTVLKISAIV